MLTRPGTEVVAVFVSPLLAVGGVMAFEIYAIKVLV